MSTNTANKVYQGIKDLLPIQFLYFDSHGAIKEVIHDSTKMWDKQMNLMDRVHPKDISKFEDTLQGLRRHKCAVEEYIRVKSPETKKYRWMEVLVCKEKYKGEVLYRWVATDVDLLKKRVEKYKNEIKQLKVMAYDDPLTGLLNRRGLWRGVKRRLEKGEEGRIGVLFIDIDDLKKANDKDGHDYGDRQIRGVTELMSRVVRKNDLVARVGGDEMIITIFEETGRVFSPKKLAQRLLDLVRSYDGLTVTISIGVSHFSTKKFLSSDKVQWKDLWSKELVKADGRTYKAKKKGKNRLA